MTERVLNEAEVQHVQTTLAALDSIGVAALAVGATVIVAAPVLWLLPTWARSRAAVAEQPW